LCSIICYLNKEFNVPFGIDVIYFCQKLDAAQTEYHFGRVSRVYSRPWSSFNYITRDYNVNPDYRLKKIIEWIEARLCSFKDLCDSEVGFHAFRNLALAYQNGDCYTNDQFHNCLENSHRKLFSRSSQSDQFLLLFAWLLKQCGKKIVAVFLLFSLDINNPFIIPSHSGKILHFINCSSLKLLPC
jgi:hypothetical protein